MAKTFEIHPAIGIARVGNSVAKDASGAFNGFYLGPEPGEVPPAQYRDASGHLKRQAARFRVFECDRDAGGKLLTAAELTGQPGVVVTWTVKLANRKAVAANFQHPARRNHATGNDVTDASLIIGPAQQDFTGANQPHKTFDGQFRTVPVNLGEAWTDAAGRLLVVGGIGKSRMVVTPGVETIGDPGHFADNDNWYDDVSDGPITASIKLANGTTVAEAQVKGSWLIVGPFDFAPPIANFITLYDAISQAVGGQVPATPSFTAHVYPILSRPIGYQWVNARARKGHGPVPPNLPGNFAARWVQLASAATPSSVRKKILDRLRDPIALPASTSTSMPRLHDETNSDAVLPPTKLQFAILQKWVAGQFLSDWNAALVEPSDIEKHRTAILNEKLPETLTRVALEACSGGAFFPGIEVGRIVKESATYLEPFRFNATTIKPGEVTQGNALPWQADFYACRWEGLHGQQGIGWWPAQRPDDVFPKATPSSSKRWDRGINSDQELVQNWDKLGVVRQVGAGVAITYLEDERTLS